MTDALLALKLLTRWVIVAGALLASAPPLLAAPTIGPWVALFKGVSHITGTNLPVVGSLPHRMVMHALRVDLTDPDIHFLTTPRFTNYANGLRETGGLTVSGFLLTNKLQAAINANFFSPSDYYLPAMSPMTVWGLQISEGVLVSLQDSPTYSAAFLFNRANQPVFISSNWPAADTTGVYTAVSGSYPVLLKGTNIAKTYSLDRPDPRTAFGLSADRRWLYLMTIDGRQAGYSEGAYDYETGEWLLLLGASDGMNMDGGGSTTLSVADSTGAAVRLNKPSAVGDSGRERTVASHFGVYAKPLPGFINDVSVIPDDTTAQISWTTTIPATSMVQYGPAAPGVNFTPEDLTLTTNHSVRLSGLTPNEGYYFRVMSAEAGQGYNVSSNFFFFTTHHLASTALIALTNSWKYSYGSDPGGQWTQLSFNDSGWDGPSPALLWRDIRATGPNPEVQPKNTELPGNENNYGYPYLTYYFRAALDLPELRGGESLAFTGYIDDGAIFYLNGREIYRLRMPGSWDGSTLAVTFPCEGDATCADQFSIDLSSITNLARNNLLAVEVHNYNLRSADLTFGLAVDILVPVPPGASLLAQLSAGKILLSWGDARFVLQQSASPAGPWADFSSTNASPVTISPTSVRAFYRLRR